MTDNFVYVKATDYNPAPPFDRAFDGCPFSDAPLWIIDAIANGRIAPHTIGGTDYAQWSVETKYGVQNAIPGDYIGIVEGGLLIVLTEKR